MSSFNLQDAVQALADGALIIENEVPSRSIDGALDCACKQARWERKRAETTACTAAIDSISDSSDAITVPIVFDAFRSGLKWVERERREDATLKLQADMLSNWNQDN
jgi:hypothetical protein